MPSVSDSIATLKPPITVEQWGELDGEARYDLVDGNLKERPDVALWHELLLTELMRYLMNYVYPRDIGKLVTSKAKLKVSTFRGREPDIFLIPKSQYQFVGKNLFQGVPPLVIEILSPTHEREDRVEKRRDYAELGVGQYWLVDFPNRRIEVFELRQGPDGAHDYELVEAPQGDTVFGPGIFPGLEIPLAKIWPTEFEDRTDQ